MTAPFDPDLMFAVLSDPDTLRDAKARSLEIVRAMAGVPTDGLTFVAFVMVLCSMDVGSTCPLGATRLGKLVEVERDRLQRALENALARSREDEG